MDKARLAAAQRQQSVSGLVQMKDTPPHTLTSHTRRRGECPGGNITKKLCRCACVVVCAYKSPEK